MKMSLPHVRLVLCEGVHDLWVMRRSLEALSGYLVVKDALDKLLHPLGSFANREAS